MKFRIKCKRLEEATRHSGAEQVVSGEVREKTNEEFFVVATFQSHTENMDAFISLDTKLISDDLKIGDVYEVEIRKV
jgi:hypothetical protein